MILQALKEYYDRKPDLPRAGFETKEIPFIVVLGWDGTPIGLSETYEGEGKARRAKRYLVPQTVKRAVNIAANLLWDNPEYALGLPLKGRPERATKQHAAFKKRIEDLGLMTDPGLAAVRLFLSKPDKVEALRAFGGSWEALRKTGANLSFQLAGQPGLIAEQPSVQAAVAATTAGKAEGKSICLVTGETKSLERLHAAIKGVWGAQSSGANIVSFNLDAFRSFNKQRGANAPVSKTAAFAYTTALNHLLSKDSKQRIQVGDASTVFWSQRRSNFEQQFPVFFNEPPSDDPDGGVRAVESLLRAIHSGAFSAEDETTRFYVLGLSPNASRIAIRFWIPDTVKGMSKTISSHFADAEIAAPAGRSEDWPLHLPLRALLAATANETKYDNKKPNLVRFRGRYYDVRPGLEGDMMRAILGGLPYPQTLLQAAIRRIRAERKVTYPRAALIKACLNRSTRFNKPKLKEDLHVSLDMTNTNVGYRLGRLFAALERIQIRKFTQKGGREPNSTIRDKYYGSASGTPVAVFGTLMRLSMHHLADLENAGERINFEKLLGEIICGIDDFPPHLQLDDQGRFAVGYYHQMQDFFTKRNDRQQPKGDHHE